MIKRTVLILVLLVYSVLLYPATARENGTDDTVFLIEKNQIHPSSIIRWGETVDIRSGGCIDGSLFLVDGRLTLDGRINEDVICISAFVEIKENAVIKGDLLVIGGTVKRHENSRVSGREIVLEVDLKEIESTLVPILFDSQSVPLFKSVKILIWLVVTLVVFASIPVKINNAQQILEKHTLKIGMTGLFSMIGFLLLTIMFIILSLFYVGIPLLLFLVLFFVITNILGRTVMFYFVGIKIAERLKLKQIAPAVHVLIGVIVYAILKFTPFIGPIVLLAINVFEVGIGMAFIFRKKLKLKA